LVIDIELKMKKLTAILFVLFVISAQAQNVESQVFIPIGGNAWAHGGEAQITNDGVEHWTDSQSIITVYFRVQETGRAGIALKLKVPDGSSTIKLSVGKKIFTKKVDNRDLQNVNFGYVDFTRAGYIKVTVKGVNKTGAEFAQIKSLELYDVPTLKVYCVYDNEGNFFHWGRRGASVHLRYVIPAEAKAQTEWFYNEITVPQGMDKIGSYFMADGFSFGYFGMQVNSATERRVLFSVWSPQQTDDPKSIPEDKRIIMLKKGENVHSGEFGNEGSGGQSYLVYDWSAGKTYSFLLHAQPDAASNTTIFTAYFKEKGQMQWHLIASFKRPQTTIYLKDLYSFVENFEPESGDQERMAQFGNQWVCTANGKWCSANEATFTADNTAKQNYRLDYAGGAKGNYFYLRNGGFFNDYTTVKQNFKRQITEAKPEIDFTALP